MLKRFIITLSSILFATSAVAQGEYEGAYACQYTDSNGFKFRDGQWERAAFRLGPPFFIKLGPETLDPQSVYEGLDVGFSTELPTCFPEETYNGAFSCASHVGETVIFNPSIREGAVSTIFGAGNTVESRDTLSIKPFVCQKV